MVSIDIDMVRTKIEELEDSSQQIDQRNIARSSHPLQQILQPSPPYNPKNQPLRPAPISSQVLVEPLIQSRDCFNICIINL